MFYKLTEKYMLRGWEKLPYALVDRFQGYTTFLTPMEMNVLKLCNGKVDFSLPVFDDQIRDIVIKFGEKGVVAKCEQNEGIEPVQKYRFYESRYIKSAHWSVTGRCNFCCRHCYMSAPDAKFGELSHEETISIVDQLAECGIMSVSLTGGECLVRRDFLDIVDRLMGHGILIKTIYSNGALVNETLLSALDSRGIHPEFNMSFDGVDGWHDWLRGIDGAAEMLDRAFKLCRQMGFPTGAEMCLHGKNRNTLRASVNYLRDVGCRSLKVVPVSNVGEWVKNSDGAALSLDELYQIYLDYIPQYYEDHMPLSIMLGGFFSADPRDPAFYDIPMYHYPQEPSQCVVCNHARTVMYISPEGRVLPCMSLSGMDIQNRFPLIREMGLKNCLNDSYYMNFISSRAVEVMEHNRECVECAYRKWCRGGCRASGLEFSGQVDPFHRDEAACKLFRSGWAAKLMHMMKARFPDKDSPVLHDQEFRKIQKCKIQKM